MSMMQLVEATTTMSVVDDGAAVVVFDEVGDPAGVHDEEPPS